jgi:hypothetical protein
MNAAWHRQHVMPRRATLAQRLAWHRAHQAACACRPVPIKLRAHLESQAPKEPKRRAAADQPSPAPPNPKFAKLVAARMKEWLASAPHNVRWLALAKEAYAHARAG